MSYDEQVSLFANLSPMTNKFRQFMFRATQNYIDNLASEDGLSAKQVLAEILPMKLPSIEDVPSIEGGEDDFLTPLYIGLLIATFGGALKSFFPALYGKSKGFVYLWLAFALVLWITPDLIAQKIVSPNYDQVPQGCEESGAPLEVSYKIDRMGNIQTNEFGQALIVQGPEVSEADISRRYCYTNQSDEGLWNWIFYRFANFWISISASSRLQLSVDYFKRIDSDAARTFVNNVSQGRVQSLSAFGNLIQKLQTTTQRVTQVSPEETFADTLAAIAYKEASVSLDVQENNTVWALKWALVITVITGVAAYVYNRKTVGPAIAQTVAESNRQSLMQALSPVVDQQTRKRWQSWTTDDLKQLIAIFNMGVANKDQWPNFVKISKEPAGLYKSKYHALFIDLRLNIHRAAGPIQGNTPHGQNRLVQEFEALIRQRLPTVVELTSPGGSIQSFDPVYF